MRLYQLVKSMPGFRARRALNDFHVKGIACNSKSVRQGFIFVAVRGAAADGRRFITEAVGRGARAVIGTGLPEMAGYPGELIEVADTRKTLSLLASEFNRRPSHRLHVTGVTGTNGKTTITYLIEEILRVAGKEPAVIGTVNYRYAGKVIPSKNTTPGPLELHGLLGQMVRAGASHAVMEVSSHALDQERTANVQFSSALFTNLTRDHMDYHKDFEEYFRAKAKLFTGLSPASFAVLNGDDTYGRRLRRMTRARVYTYGISRGDARASGLSMTVSGSSFTLHWQGKRLRMRTPLIGRHNVYNCLAAACWALAAGISPAAVRAAIAGFSAVPGRLEKVPVRGGVSVFVDYAHTDDALKNVITALRQIGKGRIIAVFGCGGDRDRGKRPKMGRVVARLADYGIVTSDNPRSEDPMKIIEAITAGMRGGDFRVIPDRKEAIAAAMAMAKKGDIVLVAGKGHENYQIFAGATVHFDDREAVRECSR